MSGLNQQFAKLSYWKRYRGFESPLHRPSGRMYIYGMLSSPVSASRLEGEVAGIARQTEEKNTGRSAVRLAHHA